MGTTIAPIIGGLLSDYLGWKSIFWFLVILSGTWLILYVIFVPETGRNVVGNGSIAPEGWNISICQLLIIRRTQRKKKMPQMTGPPHFRKRPKLQSPNPFRTIQMIGEKDIAVVLFYNALIYTAFYDLTASIPSLFAQIYHLSSLQIGLCYLPFGVGACLATWLNGKLLDWNYRRIAGEIGFTIDRQSGDDLRPFPIERARIQIIWPMVAIGLAAILSYGWALEYEANIAIPLLLQFLVGFCLNGVFNVLSILLVDLYPTAPATATAANNLVRCFLGAGGTGVIDIMINGMGRGWCFTFIAAVCIVGTLLLWIEAKYGPKWREARAVRKDSLVL